MVKRYQDELHLLKTIKGQLNTAIRHQSSLLGVIGTLELPDDFARPKGLNYTQVGEVLYQTLVMSASVSKMIEDITNIVRVEDGREKMDYSESIASKVIAEFKEDIEEAKAEAELEKAV